MEDARNAHRIDAGMGPGKNARRRSSRLASVSDHSGCSRRIRSFANSCTKRLISSAMRRRCSPDIVR
jgi:hypothetical protein